MTPDGIADKTLDATGLMCPEPVFRARQCIAGMAVGQVLEIVADDPLAALDFAVFCEKTGHELLNCDQAGGRWTFRLRKAGNG